MAHAVVLVADSLPNLKENVLPLFFPFLVQEVVLCQEYLVLKRQVTVLVWTFLIFTSARQILIIRALSKARI